MKTSATFIAAPAPTAHMIECNFQGQPFFVKLSPEGIDVHPNGQQRYTHHMLHPVPIKAMTGLSLKPLHRGEPQVGWAFWLNGRLCRLYSAPRTAEELTLDREARDALFRKVLLYINCTLMAESGLRSRVHHFCRHPEGRTIFEFCQYPLPGKMKTLASGSDKLSVLYGYILGIGSPESWTQPQGVLR